MKKYIILLLVSILLVAGFAGCSSKDSVDKVDKSISHYKGYGGIETQRNGDKFSFKTPDSEWTTVKVLPKELNLEQEFAIRAWKDIMSIHMSSNMKRIDKIKAVDEVRLCIEALAAQLKSGKMDFEDIYVGPGDIKKALKIFWESSFIAADRFGGNWDGYCSNPEIYKLKMSLQSRVVATIYSYDI